MKNKPQSFRKRGAQPGNNNALKHGLYSSIKRQSITGDLVEVSVIIGLESEISILRRLIQQIDTYMQIETIPIAGQLSILMALSHATVSLASLLRTEMILGINKKDTLQAALLSALEDLSKDVSIKLD